MNKLFSPKTPQIAVIEQSYVILNYNVVQTSDSEILSLWLDATSSIENESHIPDEGFKDMHKYTYNQVIIPIGLWTYKGIVEAIIRDKYPQDEMEAITNNMAAINAVFMQTLVTEGIVAATKYLKDSINDSNTQRFKEMQEWRAMAKKVASEIIKG